jgi:hypothetical protein
VRLFRVEVSIHRTDWIVTNDCTQNSTTAAQEAYRIARIQRNHIACAFLVWGQLKELARSAGRTIYQLKQGLLDDYLIQQLRNPSLTMRLA